eukprot:gene14208-15691_t
MDRRITGYSKYLVEKACIDAYLWIINSSLNTLCISENTDRVETLINDNNDKYLRLTCESDNANMTDSSWTYGIKSSNVSMGDDNAGVNETMKITASSCISNKEDNELKQASTQPEETTLEKPLESSQIPKISHSTPIRNHTKDYQFDLSRIEGQVGSHKAGARRNLSSNLGVIIGDITGNTAGAKLNDDGINLDVLNKQKSVELGQDVDASEIRQTWSQSSSKPSTLELVDLESLDSESESEKSCGKTEEMVKDLESHHSREIEEIRMFYETEIKKLLREKDNLIRQSNTKNSNNNIASSPATSIINLKYLEEIKNELEKRCQQYELRNRQLILKVDGLSRSCFESERRCRVLETDKSILQERCYKADQEKRKAHEELYKAQDMLNKSLGSRREVEDELLKLKRREINSESKLSDSNYALKDLRDDLSSSRRDCEEKNDVIRKLTAQRDEMQENLSDALRQISRLEEASSQRSSEKNLFQKLLEEYEMLYNQHQRIRGLYNEALKKLDGDSSDSGSRSCSSGGNKLSLKIERGNSSRKKWSVSPNSPSIREQENPFHGEKEIVVDNEAPSKSSALLQQTSKESAKEALRYSSPPHPAWKRDSATRPGGSYRNSTGSILSWETGSDVNNNITSDAAAMYKDGGKRTEEDISSDAGWKRRSFPEGSSQAVESPNSPSRFGYRSGNKKDSRDWVVHNLNGITRFDVVFSPPNQSGNAKRNQESEKKDTRRSLGLDSTPFSHMQTLENGTRQQSTEVASLERELSKLSGEKNEIESQLSRLPSTGSGGGRSRKMNAEKQELLEERLEEVSKCIGNIKMNLKRHKALPNKIDDIISIAEEKNIKVDYKSRDYLDKLVGNRPHQSIVMKASSISYENINSLHHQRKDRFCKSPEIWLALDQIQDPMNFGAILRSAGYFGINGIIASKRNSCRLSPVVSKASAGTMEWLKIYGAEDLPYFLKKQAKANWDIIGSTMSDENLQGSLCDCATMALEKPSILVLGNEGIGIREEVMNSCTKFITIPSFTAGQPQHDLDSLNVSVATGILLYNLVNKRKN